MSSTPPPEEAPRSLLDEVIRLGRAYLAAGAEFWGRSWEINARYAQQAMSTAVAAPGTTPQAGDIGSTSSGTYKHYAAELAMVPWLAAARLDAELASSANRGAGHRAGQAVTSQEKSSAFVQGGKSVTLPVSVREARHGLAIYAVPSAAGQRSVDEDGQHFKVVELGRGQTPLAIFIIDQQDGDLGTYGEFGIAFFVIPRDEPWAMPGWYIKMSPVNDAFSRDAGNHLWSYRKTTDYDLALAYANDQHVRCTLSRGSYRVLTISFPRGGSGSSTAIPWYTYTVGNGLRLPRGVPHRTIFTRTSRGERIRAGGAGVKLEPGSAAENASDRLWKLVYDLGLTENSQPFLHSWTEHLSGEFGSPSPCGRQGTAQTQDQSQLPDF
jgi:hypothetical protein